MVFLIRVHPRQSAAASLFLFFLALLLGVLGVLAFIPSSDERKVT